MLYYCVCLAGNLSSSDELAELSRRLTTTPEYLLKSSLAKKDEQHTDRNNVACKSSVLVGSDVKFAETKNRLLTSRLASSVTENRLLKQLETTNISHEMSRLCVTPSLVLAPKEIISDAPSTLVAHLVPDELTPAVCQSVSTTEKHHIKRRALDSKEKPVKEKLELKPIKKVQLPVPEQADTDESVSSFELPNYRLTHEHVEHEKSELFLLPEEEDAAVQLMRPVVDVPSIKVVTHL